MSTELNNRVLSHDKQLVKIETILERVATNQDGINQSVATIAINLAKKSSLEEVYKDRFDILHSRIDKEVDIREKKIQLLMDELKVLEVFSFLSKYPKITVLVCGLLYATAISDIRHKVIDNIWGKTSIVKTIQK